MTKEEIEDILCDLEIDHEPGGGGWIDGDSKKAVVESLLKKQDEYARQVSIAFFKWYGVKMATFIEYITKVKPLVESQEIEEKIKEFEGKTFDELYDIFLAQYNKEGQ